MDQNILVHTNSNPEHIFAISKAPSTQNKPVVLVFVPELVYNFPLICFEVVKEGAITEKFA